MFQMLVGDLQLLPVPVVARPEARRLVAEGEVLDVVRGERFADGRGEGGGGHGAPMEAEWPVQDAETCTPQLFALVQLAEVLGVNANAGLCGRGPSSDVMSFAVGASIFRLDFGAGFVPGLLCNVAMGPGFRPRSALEPPWGVAEPGNCAGMPKRRPKVKSRGNVRGA